ncbi:hypothetical protein [Thermococcus sp. GR6]|uniref:hypothetical protein n=1 Tax=Thermococcus sp. GR6 TaxID=1638256 RepID=UPI001431C0E8|nr:hypothetical protein [Thermococcus sp. GR6]NJE42651.1 hypothetical protein [Thermococcus sp. GR6]
MYSSRGLFDMILDFIGDFVVIVVLSIAFGAPLQFAASKLGYPEIGKALVLVTLAVLSSLIFRRGFLKGVDVSRLRRQTALTIVGLLMLLIVLSFELGNGATGSLLLGMLVALFFPKIS